MYITMAIVYCIHILLNYFCYMYHIYKIFSRSNISGGIRYFSRRLPAGLCYRLPPVRSRPSAEPDEDGVIEGDSCLPEYVFAVAAYRCDLYYSPLGRGVLTTRTIGGIDRGASSQAVLLKKNHHSPLMVSPDALVVGYDLGLSVTMPNLTAFDRPMGNLKPAARITSAL